MRSNIQSLNSSMRFSTQNSTDVSPSPLKKNHGAKKDSDVDLEAPLPMFDGNPAILMGNKE